LEAKHKADIATYNKQNGYALKLEMIQAYGGKCSCCGLDIPEFLTLDILKATGQPTVASARQMEVTECTSS